MADDKQTVDVNQTVTNFDGETIVVPAADGKGIVITIGHALANVVGGMRPREGEEVLRIQEFGIRIVQAMKGDGTLEMDDADRDILKEGIRQDIQRGRVAEREGHIGGSSVLMLAPLMRIADRNREAEGQGINDKGETGDGDA